MDNLFVYLYVAPTNTSQSRSSDRNTLGYGVAWQPLPEVCLCLCVHTVAFRRAKITTLRSIRNVQIRLCDDRHVLITVYIVLDFFTLVPVGKGAPGCVPIPERVVQTCNLRACCRWSLTFQHVRLLRTIRSLFMSNKKKGVKYSSGPLLTESSLCIS